MSAEIGANRRCVFFCFYWKTHLELLTADKGFGRRWRRPTRSLLDGSHQEQETKGQLKRTEPTAPRPSQKHIPGEEVLSRFQLALLLKGPFFLSFFFKVFNRKFHLLEKEMMMVTTRRLRDLEAEDKKRTGKTFWTRRRIFSCQSSKLTY